MALSNQEQNFVSELMALGAELLSVQHDIQTLAARWNQNGLGSSIDDTGLAEISTFAHLTAAEVSSGVTAVQAVDTALGDYVSGQSANLIKLKG